MKEKEKAWEPTRVALEAKRADAIKQAEAALSPLEAKFAPTLAKLEKERADRIAVAKGKFDEYDKSAPDRALEWARKYVPIEWKEIRPTGC